MYTILPLDGIMVYMAMNIKNAETHRLAQQLAALMGTSITEAITQALREKLRGFEDDRAKTDRLLALARDFTSRIPKDAVWIDDDFLYDEFGLPK